MLLWITPIYLLIIPIFFYFFVHEMFLGYTTLMAVWFIYMLEDISYRKKFLKAIGK